MSHTRRAVRAVRAVLFAMVCVSLAGAGHALSSSHPVPPWVLLAALPPVAVAAWCAAGRARGTAAIGAGLVAAQLVLHLVLTEAHAFPGHALEPHHSGTDARHMATAAAGWAPPTDTLSMTAAHLLAALGCAWWLACGERAVVQLAHATLAALLRPFRRPVPVRLPQRPPGRPAVAVDEQPAAVRLLRHAVSRRGPPGAYGRSPHAPYGAARAGLLLPMPRSVRP
ncbi:MULTISPECIES: hypothetical protein [Streptomyces]|uniref:hypothetical protein n=1 Tax=Streptomyces TaxID=1883 RepID=UPI001CFC6981|nr:MULTISPECIES: hypothetical protein [Streptomyces]WQG70012.1 hypothetical protein SR864_02035 [Streptomyces albidoflavus]WSD56626.1 hypothetical protein OHA76_29480 [Streptomyces albidoflavus]WTC45283.1 hypothetical protein OH810_28795 [Streptomyces albidoflavus]